MKPGGGGARRESLYICVGGTSLAFLRPPTALSMVKTMVARKMHAQGQLRISAQLAKPKTSGRTSRKHYRL